MKESVLHLFKQYSELAIVISLLLNIVIAVLGVVPSFFITAANILFFGFWQGTFISFLGEAIGALVAFVLYRSGFKKQILPQLKKFPKAERLIEAKGWKAFSLIVSLRLLPFVPSGLVTFAASVGSISILNFFAASSVGKIPALLMEAYSVSEVTKFHWQGKLILLIAGVLCITYIIRSKL